MATDEPPAGRGTSPPPPRATEILAAFVAAQSGLLRGFAEEEAKRTERLREGHRRLAQGGGADPERLRSIAAEIELAGALGDDLAIAAERQGRLPPIKEGDTLVHGRVVDAKGHPRAGVTVALDDDANAFGDVLGVAVTDEFGDFSMTYRDKNLADLRASRPDLVVTVGDATTKMLHRTPSGIHFDAGPVEYLEVVVPGPRGAPSKKATFPRASRTRKKPASRGSPAPDA